MPHNLSIDNLLQEITAEEGETFSYNREAIVKDLEEQRSAYANWGISLLSIIGGILASVLFLGFLFVAGILESGGGMVVIGLLLIGGSVAVNKAVKQLLLDTATVTFYLAGYGMLAVGLMNLQVADNMVALICLLLSVAVVVISSSAMLVLVSVLIASGSLLSLVLMNDTQLSIHFYTTLVAAGFTYISLYQAKLLTWGKAINQRYHPVRVGLLMSLLVTMSLLGHSGVFDGNAGYQYVSSTGIIAAIIVSIRHISRRLFPQQATLQLVKVYSVSLLVLLPTLFAPAISGAFLIILLSFHSGHRGGFVLGIAALVYFVSRYYYDLQFTLLTKSIVLMLSGAVFLGLFFGLKKQLQTS